MATVGYTNIGATGETLGTADNTNPAGLMITMLETGTITKITAYVNNSVSSSPQTCKLYTGSAGSLGILQATTNTGTVTTTPAWVDFVFASPFSASVTTYWLEFTPDGANGPGGNRSTDYYDSGGDVNTGYFKLDNGTPSYDSNRRSIYATYTPTSGPSWSIALV